MKKLIICKNGIHIYAENMIPRLPADEIEDEVDITDLDEETIKQVHKNPQEFVIERTSKGKFKELAKKPQNI